ncbi:MAG: PEP-CTERM sorting domain-containing protein [Akkermansiaceae bacterium]
MNLLKINPMKVALMSAASLAFASSTNAALIGLWNFDGDYANDVSGGSTIDASNDAANSPGSFINTTIDGNAATVLDYSAAASGSYFEVTNDAAANAGGTATNNYSIVMDVYFDDVSAGFHSLLSTGNFGDVDMFVRDNGDLDYSFSAPNAVGAISSGQWYRIAVTREAGANILVYIDGSLAITHNAYGVDDGDYRINGTWRPFSDNSGDTNDMQMNSLAYYDNVLTPAEITTLAGASAAGIVPVPEPSSSALLGLGCLTLVIRRRK